MDHPLQPGPSSGSPSASPSASPVTLPSLLVSPAGPYDEHPPSPGAAPPIPSLGTLIPGAAPTPSDAQSIDGQSRASPRISPVSPSVQIRRMRSNTSVRRAEQQPTQSLRFGPPPPVALSPMGRYRSPSLPPPRPTDFGSFLPPGSRPTSAVSDLTPGLEPSAPPQPGPPSELDAAARKSGRRRAFTAGLPSSWRYSKASKPPNDGDTTSLTSSGAMSARQTQQNQEEMYSQHLVDLLDVMDPEVSTVSSLANVQNSLFVPNIGRFSRAPIIKLSPRTTAAANRYSRLMEEYEHKEPGGKGKEPDIEEAPEEARVKLAGRMSRANSVMSGPVVHDVAQAQEGHWAVLPDDVDWAEWTQEEKDEIDDYVRHLLHSKKEMARRRWRGFIQFASRPFGLFVTIYASLLTFWGAAWMLFLIGWINVGERKDYFVEICDQILVALFCLVGIGMFPFRIVDTYHMIYIAHYHRKSLRLRAERGLKPLKDKNDLPPPQSIETAEGGLAIRDDVPEQVLSLEEEEKFLYHQTKFCHSHTFYRPHETSTHYAFPLDLLIVIVCLLDAHSCFQCTLGGCTWGIKYTHRPAALTAVVLCCSLSCNITSGLLIAYGDRKIRKKDVLEKQLRQALTEEAIKRKEMQRKIASRQDTEQQELLAKEELKSLQDVNDHSTPNSVPNSHIGSAATLTQPAYPVVLEK